MQEGVYKTPVGDVSELRQRLIDCWSSLSQDVINDAINQWQVRLRACVKAKGCHFWAPSALKPALFRATHDFQKKHALFLVCSLRDDNMITSKPTWKLKHTNTILEYSEYFCQISSKSLLVILSYTVVKLRRFFWDTVYLLLTKWATGRSSYSKFCNIFMVFRTHCREYHKLAGFWISSWSE